MLDFRYLCPHCGQRMKCDGRLAGRAVRCPGCRRIVTLVPSGTGDVPQPKIAKPPRSENNQS